MVFMMASSNFFSISRLSASSLLLSTDILKWRRSVLNTSNTEGPINTSSVVEFKLTLYRRDP